MTVCILDRPRHEQLISRGPRGRRPDPADLRRRRRRRHLGVPAELRHRPAGRDRRHTGGHHRRSRDPLHGRRDPGQAGARRTTKNARRPIDAGYDLDQILFTEDLVSGENVFFCATGVTDGDLLKGVSYLRRRLHDAVDRHALQVGHGADDRGLPPAVQAQRILRHRFHRRQQRRPTAAVISNH